jgi:hypothetical protein
MGLMMLIKKKDSAQLLQYFDENSIALFMTYDRPDSM